MATAQVIQIEDAKLKTLAVEIKALTVNGKQMTLSTFRQLPEETMFGPEFTLKGIPWGVVRYTWGDQTKGGFHIVWQKDQVLYRSHSHEYECWTVVVDCEEWRALEDAREREDSCGGTAKHFAFMDATKALKAFNSRFRREMKSLEQKLPQLFIAV